MRSRTLVGVVAGLALLLPFAWLAAVLAGPSDGTGVHPVDSWQAGEVVVARTLGPTPLREDDVVVAVDGVLLRDRAQGRAPAVQRSVGDVVEYTVVRDDARVTVPVTLTPYPVRQALTAHWVLLVLVLSLDVIAVVVVVHRPHDQAAWVLVGLAAVVPLGFTQWPWSLQAIDLVRNAGVWPHAVGRVAWTLVWAGLLPHFALVFPEPPAALRRRPWRAGWIYGVLAGACGVLVLAGLPGARSGLERLDRWDAVLAPVAELAPLLVVVLMLVSYRRTATGLARQRMRWVGLTLLVAVLVAVLFERLPTLLFGRPLLPPHLEPLLFLLSVLAAAAGILRYQLFDIEVILRRSLVYGSLTAALLAIYVGTVVLLGRVVAGPSALGALCGTAVVALCVQPLRAQLRRVVGHLVYGDREDPYAVLSRLSRLEPGDSPTDLLPALTETLASALRLPYVRIELDHPDGVVQAQATFGERPHDAPLVVPLQRAREVTGRLLLDVGAGREPFGPAEQRLLDDVGRQISGAVRTALLAEALQASRQRVIASREEERRRVRRDLHDGVGPTLAAIVMQLDAAQDLLHRDPPAADRVLTAVRDQARTAITDVRRVVDELRPPALDQLGLVGALRERAGYFSPAPGAVPRQDLQVRIDAEGDLEPLPAAVEVAAFCIVMEALNNAARHSGASRCAVRLWRDRSLHVEVRDNGCGLPRAATPGVGLGSMRERAVELGGTCSVSRVDHGGTAVHAALPLDGTTRRTHEETGHER